MKLPENIGGGLDLTGLTSAKGLKLPENIEGGLYLGRLISAEGLDLSNTNIWRFLNLSILRSAEGLKLPKNFDIKILFAPQHIIDEINNHPEKYYIKEDDLSEVKEQVLNAKYFTEEQRAQAIETLDDVEEVTEYRGKHFK